MTVDKFFHFITLIEDSDNFSYCFYEVINIFTQENKMLLIKEKGNGGNRCDNEGKKKSCPIY